MADYFDVLSAARSLSDSDRMRLVATLCDDIPPEQWPLPDSETLAEAARRSAEYDRAESTASPASDVLARARQRAGLNG